MKDLCRFCNIIDGKSNKEEDRLIYETKEYFAIASIGALVEGWILISPKEHLVSMKELYFDKNFIAFTNDLLAIMRRHYDGTIIAFEHGPNKCGSSTSCGTNHAHLHLVPYPKSLYENMVESGFTWEPCHSTQIASLAGNDEYLYYCELSNQSMWDDSQGLIHILREPTSQYFRKIIAQQLNCIDKYDYKKYPFLETTILTSHILQDAVISR